MAVAETAKLIASLELKDHFTPAANKAMASLGKLETRAYRVGQQVGKGLKNAATNIRNVGLVAGAGLAVAVNQGIQSLADLETATTSVDGAIKQMGATGKVTSAQIAGWANEIEASVGAAFDDKDITAAAATLLRFGKVTPANLKPALVVMTDLAAKTGSVDSAAALLAKALADPAKAAGKLTRAGVVLTDAQKKQLISLTSLSKEEKKHYSGLLKSDKKAAERYKAAKLNAKQTAAQAFLLKQLAQTTKGAAAASQGPYQRSISMLKDAWEDATRALAVGFLPVITKVSDLLQGELAKPGTLDNIRKFGEGLAGGLDKLVEIAKNLPWGAIGDSFRVAGAGAGAILEAFTKIPPWVQTAILTGWGLNKLTGGALGGIVKELAGGLIKGVLGMNAGVVNINAGVVNGVGGVPGAAAGAAAGGLGLVSKVFLVGEAIGLAVAVNQVRQGISDESTAHATAIQDQTTQWLAQQPSRADLVNGLAGVDAGIRDIKSNPLNVLVQGEALTKLEQMASAIKGALSTTDEHFQGTAPLSAAHNAAIAGTSDSLGARDEQRAAIDKATDAIETMRGSIGDRLVADTQAALLVRDAASRAGQLGAAATSSGTAQIVGAIGRIPSPVLTVNVSPTTINRTTTITNRYGSPSGSRNANSNGSGTQGNGGQ